MRMNQVSIDNKLLAALPRAGYQHLLANLEPVTLAYGDVLYEPGDPITPVYFPNDSLRSSRWVWSAAKAWSASRSRRESA
jgi:hypothetical protein